MDFDKQVLLFTSMLLASGCADKKESNTNSPVTDKLTAAMLDPKSQDVMYVATANDTLKIEFNNINVPSDTLDDNGHWRYVDGLVNDTMSVFYKQKHYMGVMQACGDNRDPDYETMPVHVLKASAPKNGNWMTFVPGK